jgi:cytochrome P450
MLGMLVTLSSNATSWWWQGINNKSNDPGRLLLASSLLVLVLSWFTWILLIKKSNNKHPPLPPGPYGLPLIGSLLSLDWELHVYFTTLARTYGSIFTIWLGRKLTLVVSSPAIAREMLKDNDVVFANHDVTIAGTLSSYGGRDIVWNPYGAEWRMLRKVLVREMLSNTSLDSVYYLRRQEIRKTIGFLYSQGERPVKLGELMFLTALNVATNMVWGGDATSTDMAGSTESVAAEFKRMIIEMTNLLGTQNISDMYPSLAWCDLQGIASKMKRLAKQLDVIFDGIIDQRLKINEQNGTGKGDGGKSDKDFLQFLLQLKDEGDPKTPLTMNHIKALFLDMIIGGTDTTNNTLEFAMAEIMNKPEVMQRVKQELDAVVGKNTTLEESHIPKLPYLYAVMKETLRLHPILPLIGRHYTSETCIIGGYTIPKDARILINVWAMQRDSSVWKNPLEFDPERFLDGKWDYSGKEFEYLPFGSGRRNCAGTAMAQRMFMFMLGLLLHAFDWKLPEGETLDLSAKFGFLLKKKIPLVVIPTPRLSDPTLYQ